jgi:hypothetical protein
MSSPEPTQDDEQTGETDSAVPPANPGYATPPPEGTSSAENE